MGVPCRVVYRPSAEEPIVLWRARYEKDFCVEKAEETRSVLEAKGYNCTVSSPGFVRRLTLRPGPVNQWRCSRLSEQSLSPNGDWPPKPEIRPCVLMHRDEHELDLAFQQIVERDLAILGAPTARKAEIVASAHGDLNGDDVADAALLVATWGADAKLRYLLMAYLGDRAGHGFVDAKILPGFRSLGARPEGSLDIKAGKIRAMLCYGKAPRLLRYSLRDLELSRVQL